MRLRDLHITSGVPHFEEKLMTPMERFFSRLPVAGPMERNNYCSSESGHKEALTPQIVFQLDDVLPWNKKVSSHCRSAEQPDPDADDGRGEVLRPHPSRIGPRSRQGRQGRIHAARPTSERFRPLASLRAPDPSTDAAHRHDPLYRAHLPHQPRHLGQGAPGAGPVAFRLERDGLEDCSVQSHGTVQGGGGSWCVRSAAATVR
jgi:hypothetical protein